MRPILLTGFEAFGGATRNPSGEVALRLDGSVVAGRAVRGAMLRCVFGDSLVELLRLVEDLDPAAVICLGVAADRRAITPERTAFNLDEARIPDNAGAQPVRQPVVSGGPPAYSTTLPVVPIVAALKAQGFPAEISESAGTFVCNHVFYGLMHDLRHSTRTLGGFIHIPSSGLSIDRMVAAIALAIETIARAD